MGRGIHYTPLVRTDLGRWIWWPALQTVDYLERGQRVTSHTLHLTSRRNTEVGALTAIVEFLQRDQGRES